MLTILSLMLAAGTPLPAGMSGGWDLDASGTAIFRLEIAKTPAGPTATWVGPQNMSVHSETYSHVGGPIVRLRARNVTVIGDDVEVSFDSPSPHGVTDIFRLHRIDADHVVATYGHTSSEIFTMVRARNASTALGPWDESRSYVRTDNRPTNAEMTAIFDADQAARSDGPIDWSSVRPADDKRRARTQQLLDSGVLQSGEDYYHAAFVFQHGGGANDFLKAHLLAMIAVARGKPDAIWIASATLDRYLHTIGKPQVLGTQFQIPNDAPITQEPYDRTLVSDAMRKALHVPTLAEQEARRASDQARRTGTKAP